jgi:hypothetical protein
MTKRTLDDDAEQVMAALGRMLEYSVQGIASSEALVDVLASKGLLTRQEFHAARLRNHEAAKRLVLDAWAASNKPPKRDA